MTQIRVDVEDRYFKQMATVRHIHNNMYISNSNLYIQKRRWVYIERLVCYLLVVNIEIPPNALSLLYYLFCTG